MMFGRRQPEPPRPLMGEDFDMYPDLGDRPKKTAEEIEAEVDEPDEPIEPSPFAKRIAAFSNEQWTKLQIGGGVLLGLIAALSLTVLNEIVGSMGFIIAAALAMLGPNMLEKRGERKIPKLRIAMIITLVVGLGVYMLYGYVINPSYFEQMRAAATAAPTAAATAAPASPTP